MRMTDEADSNLYRPAAAAAAAAACDSGAISFAVAIGDEPSRTRQHVDAGGDHCLPEVWNANPTARSPMQTRCQSRDT